MNVTSSIKKAMEVSLIASFLSLTASPALNYMGIEIPSNIDAGEALGWASTAGIIIATILLATSLILGYASLTGWTGFRGAPLTVRLLLSLILGTSQLSISGLLAPLLPIPFLPTIATALLTWLLLRYLSKLATIKSVDVHFEEALRTARNVVNETSPNSGKLDLTESKEEGENWRISLTSRENNSKYEVNVNAKTGSVETWRRL
jgi:hypothetical protein